MESISSTSVLTLNRSRLVSSAGASLFSRKSLYTLVLYTFRLVICIVWTIRLWKKKVERVDEWPLSQKLLYHENNSRKISLLRGTFTLLQLLSPNFHTYLQICVFTMIITISNYHMSSVDQWVSMTFRDNNLHFLHLSHFTSGIKV